MYQAATEIRQEVRDPRMERVGVLNACSTMIKSRIIPILTYGTECWMNVTKKQYHAMEEILKEAISRILSIPGNGIYYAMILEMSTFRVEVWMDYLKIMYFMKKIHDKGQGKLYRSLREEILTGDETGYIGDVRRSCEKYELQDVTLVPLLLLFCWPQFGLFVSFLLFERFTMGF